LLPVQRVMVASAAAADKSRRLNMNTIRTAAVVLIAFAAAVVASAQAPANPPSTSTDKPAAAHPPSPAASARQVHPAPMVNAADLKWGAAPPAFNAGAQMTVIDGDPAKPGPFVIRAKFPAGFKVMPHFHPTDESVTVISGTLAAAMGEKWDEAAMKTFTAGAFARMPAKSPHYVQAKEDTIVQVHGIGPFTLTYVNPNDDPRKKKTQ
jgi:quercetin dioxygenase-like cupin family protein